MIESTLLNIGLSWTFSKIIPYLFLLICGFFLFFQIRKGITGKILKNVLSFLILFLPFVIGFILHPIFEGDFSKDGSTSVKNSSSSDFKKDGLMVISIADCPFCFGAIEKLKLIKKRNPSLNIEFVVCTKNKEYIKNYMEEIDNSFPIRLADNADSLVASANFRFPAFVVVRNKKPVYVWSNDEFGVRAIDQLESDVK